MRIYVGITHGSKVLILAAERIASGSTDFEKL